MTDVAALEAYAGTLSESASKSAAASEKHHVYIHGDEFTDVVTESGAVPTIAKQVGLTQVKVTAALQEVAAQMAGAMTYATTAAGLASTVSGGYFSVPSAVSNEYLILYQNVSGAAVEKKRYPSTKALASTVKSFLTLALMLADLSPDDSVRGIVTSDPTLSNNGWYKKSGASGAGNWVWLVDQPVSKSTLSAMVSVPAATSPTALTADQMRNSIITLEGAPTVDPLVTIPTNTIGRWTFANGFTSSRTVRLQLGSNAATRLLIAPGTTADIQSDGVALLRLNPVENLAGYLGVLDAFRVNSGKTVPFALRVRNGVTSTSYDFFNNVILSAKVEGAEQGYYYRIRYYWNGTANPGAGGVDAWFIERCPIATFGTAEEGVAIISGAMPQPHIDKNKGIQTYRLTSTADAGFALTLTLDTDAMSAFTSQVGTGSTASPGYSWVIDPAFYFYKSTAVLPSASIDANVIYIETGVDFANIRMKGSKADSNIYLRWRLSHEVAAFDLSNAYGNSDLWRIKGVYECQLSGGSFTDTRSGVELVTIGEMECAIKEVGADDFIGGFHGDEKLITARLLLDGVEIPLGAVGSYTGRKVEFMQYSTLYRCNTQNPLAEHSKHLIFHGRKLTLGQYVKWLDVAVLASAMMPMLPIKRLSADTTGESITDRAVRSPKFVTEDVAAPGFDQQYTTGTLPVANIWGRTSGISAQVEVKKWPATASRQFYIANSTYYNKFYYSLAGINSSTQSTHTTAIGEEWETEAEIYINSDR